MPIDFKVLRENAFQLSCAVHGDDRRTVSENVRIAVGKDHDFTCLEGYGSRVVFDMCIAAALGQQMIDDDMFRVRGEIRGHDVRGGGAKAPRRGTFSGIEDGPVEFDGLEDFGQDVHATSSSRIMPANHAGRPVK
jgi:hypothetical protein